MPERSGRFEDLIRQDRPQDPKRWALVRGTQAVMAGFFVLCLSAAKQVWAKGDIQQGVGVVLISLAALLIGGTVAAHRKADDPIPPSPEQP
jgi:ABC-type uncharacterized transport system permease subunit